MNENLLPCPFCGGEARAKDFPDGSGDIACTVCGFKALLMFQWKRAGKCKAEAIAAWNHRAEPEARILTVEELRKMRYNMPVWMKSLENPRDSRWYLTPDLPFYEEEYGKTWLAYDRQPEEGAQ